MSELEHEEPRGEVEILDFLINKSSESMFIVAPRGAGKSNLLGVFAYLLSQNGWVVVILDPKNTFRYFNLLNIAIPRIAAQVRDYWGDDLEPPKRIEFYTPRYAWDFREASIPDYYKVAPVSLDMLNPEAFELLQLKSNEQEALQYAYDGCGMHNATVDCMLNYLKRTKKLNPRLAKLLFSGLFAESSPIHPEKILSKDPGTIVILSSLFITEPNIPPFWYAIFLRSLLSKAMNWPHRIDLAIMIDETLVLSHGSMQTSTTWWFTRDFHILLSQGRQVGELGNVRTRAIFSSQVATGIYFELMKLCGIGIVSPRTINADGERSFLRKNFTRLIKPLNIRREEPGIFAVYTQQKKIGVYKFPLSPLFIPLERLSGEEEVMQRKFIQRAVRKKILVSHYSEALERYRDELHLYENQEELALKVYLNSYSKPGLCLLYAVNKYIEEQGLVEDAEVSIRELGEILLRDTKMPRKLGLMFLSPSQLASSRRKMKKLGLYIEYDKVIISRNYILRFYPVISRQLTLDRLIEMLIIKAKKGSKIRQMLEAIA